MKRQSGERTRVFGCLHGKAEWLKPSFSRKNHPPRIGQQFPPARATFRNCVRRKTRLNSSLVCLLVFQELLCAALRFVLVSCFVTVISVLWFLSEASCCSRSARRLRIELFFASLLSFSSDYTVQVQLHLINHSSESVRMLRRVCFTHFRYQMVACSLHSSVFSVVG